MIFEATVLPGVFRIFAEPHVDARGFFARLYCPDEFTKAGIQFSSTQINLSRNTSLHTLRGMHWQDAPFAEAKIVRCMQGRVFDVVADIRKDSATFGRWIGHELDAQSADALFVPEGYAHGFLTLEPDTDVFYQMGRMYEPAQARGFRYDDPAFNIQWPHVPQDIGEADKSWPAFGT